MSEPGAVTSRWQGLALVLAGHSAYQPTWRLQQRIWELRGRLELPDTLLLLQHAPVVTLGRHGDAGHVLPGSELEVVRSDRGGDVTYHGPGQLTGYLICDLRAHDLSVRAFVTALEEALIRTLADFGIPAQRRAGLTGVWTRAGACHSAEQPTVKDPAPRWAKIAALGVRIARGVSLHGIALNVCGPLTGFAQIIPCGLAGEAVTSMEQVLALDRGVSSGISVSGVAQALCARFSDVFQTEYRMTHGDAIGSDADADRLLASLPAQLLRKARKPTWLRTRLPGGTRFTRVRAALQAGRLHTVCESARCPNCHECWNAGTATFLILGESCTRGCRFCAVGAGVRQVPDAEEPARVARAAAELKLRHVVVTSVTRDDLPDGGARQFVATIAALRAQLPRATVEVLIPDFGGSSAALEEVIAARPDVLGHNLETVARLYPVVRPGANYARSLGILSRAAAAGLHSKSGLMLGLGESASEVRELLRDLREAACAHVTIGQYLRPAPTKIPVQRYYTEQDFSTWSACARGLGFARVESGPLVRSSYHAGDALGGQIS